MRFRTVLIYSIATAAVGLVTPSITPILHMPFVAQAETNVSISIGTFYDDLAPHGSWVTYHDSYVFVPSAIAVDWRPYTEGHWVHTRRYGWMWVSEEPFGWATYHYGRWGYAEDIGWYWVPGRRWAPAWVAWRRGGDYLAWAPLPPGRGDDLEIEISINDVPDIYWVAVLSRNFLDDDLSVVIIDDDSERVRIVETAEPVGAVTIENNIVVNNVIDVDYVEKTTEKKVGNVEVKETDDPKQAGKESGGQIAAFTGEIKEDKDAKPSKVKEVEEVKKDRADAGQPGQDQQQEDQDQTTKKSKAAGESAQPEEGQAEQDQGQIKKKKAKASSESAEPVEGQAEQEQPIKQKKAKASGESAEPAEGQAGQEQPIKKKKAKASGESAQPEEGQAEQEQEQTTTKKAKASGKPAQPDEGQPQTKQKKLKGSEEPGQGKKQQQGCDPATGQNC